MGESILKDVLIIFAAAIPFIIILHKLRLPALIGFLLTGALIGPSGIGLVSNSNHVDLLAEIGVTLLLFSIGVEFSLSSLAQLKSYVLKGGSLQILGCIALGVLTGFILGWPLQRGLFFGCVISLSSTAVVLTSLMNQRHQDSLQGRISTGILILQDLAIVPMLVLLPRTHSLNHGSIWRELALDGGRIIFLFGLTYLISRFVAKRFFGIISRTRSRELFLVSVITFALGFAWITNSLGLSFALGAFLAGLMIGNTDYRTEALTEIAPFRYAFSSLFFVSIGMLVDFEFLSLHWPTILFLIVLIPTLKTILISGIMLSLKAPIRMAINVGIILGQIGEFSFLLATLGRQTGTIGFQMYQYIITAAVFTMLGTPIMVRQSIPLAEKVARLPLIRRLGFRPEESEFSQKSDQMSHHVIISGFGPLGETFGRILDEYKIPHIILELNPDTVERIREKKKNVIFGDGASEEILYHCGIERARLLAITIPDFLNNTAAIHQARRVNPNIKIIARAKHRKETQALYEAGADIVVSEELEGGIEMGRYALKELGIPTKETDAFIEKVREFGSADFF